MYDFCAICMVRKVSLVEIDTERRLLLVAIVTPLINLASLKPCCMLLCLDCNRMLTAILKFQQTVFKGMMNLIALQKLQYDKTSCHNLPEVINGQCDQLLPVFNEETVHSSDIFHFARPDMRRQAANFKSEDMYCSENTMNMLSVLRLSDANNIRILLDDDVKTLDPPVKQNGHGKPVKKIATLVRKKETILTEPQTTKLRNGPSASLSLDSKSERDGSSNVDISGSRPKEVLDSSAKVMCESDFDNPDTAPGYERVVATSSLNDHWYAETVFNNPDSGPHERMVATSIINDHVHADTDFDNPDTAPVCANTKRILSDDDVNTLDPPEKTNGLRNPVKKIAVFFRKKEPILTDPQTTKFRNGPCASLINDHGYAEMDFDNPDTELVCANMKRILSDDDVNTLGPPVKKNGRRKPFKKIAILVRKKEAILTEPQNTKFRNGPSASLSLDSKSERDRSLNVNISGSRPKEVLDSSAKVMCESDFDNPDSVPHERMVATSIINNHGYADTDFDNPDTVPVCANMNNMAVLVPIENTKDKRISINKIESSEVKNTNNVRRFYKKIKVALKFRPILPKPSPESSKPELELSHELDSFSTHELGKKSTHVLDSKSTHELDSESTHNLEPESTHNLEPESIHNLEPESTHDIDSIHELDSEPTYNLDPESTHDMDSTHELDSESTLSCHSNYEDAERFPNIVFAKAFNGISEDGENEMSEDIMKKLHVVTNPPSEWPCTWERCFLRHSSHEEDCSDDSDSDSERTRSKVKCISRRPGKECKLCDRTFASLYHLWVHYEREHVDICVKECCNGPELKNHTNRQLKPTPRYNCQECGFDTRTNTQLKVHLATQRHRLRSQWRYQCDICKRKFEDEKGMAEHIEREHVVKEANRCPMCSATFRSARALRKHAAAHARAHTHMHAHTDVHTTRADHAQETRTRKRPRGHDARKLTLGAGPASAPTNGNVQKRPRKRKQNPGKIRKRTQNAGKRTQNARKIKGTRRDMGDEDVEDRRDERVAETMGYLKSRNCWERALQCT